MPRYSRRNALKSVATGCMIGLAGCISQNSSGGNTSGNSTEGNTSGGTVTGSASVSDLEPVSATFASALQSGTYENQAIERFKKKMERDTNGKFKVKHVPGGSYGGEGEQTKTLSTGSIEGMGAGGLPIVLWAGDHYFPSSPWVVDSYDHLLKIMYSDEYRNIFKNIINDHSVRPIGRTMYMGMRSHMANKPVRTPSDVKGLNLRVPGIDPWVAMWEAVGANPTSIPADEAYSALQTGTADGITTDVNQALSNKYYEVVSHYNMTEQLVGNRNLWINEGFFQKLDKTYQNLVMKNGWEASVEISKKAQKEEQKNVKELEEKDITIVKDVKYDAFKKAATPRMKELFSSGKWAKSLSWVQKQKKQGKIPTKPPSYN